MEWSGYELPSPPPITTEVGERVVPRLRESRLMTPSGHGGEFTQPRDYSFAHPCMYRKMLDEMA